MANNQTATRSKKKTKTTRRARRGRRQDTLKILSTNLVSREVDLHEEGPRGFNLGPKWIQSIKDGKGIAMYPSNLPKLVKTAEVYNVPPAKLKKVKTQRELVELLSSVV